MNPIAKMIINLAITTLTGQFPEFTDVGADIQQDISNGKVTLENVEQVIIDAATGVETLLPSDKSLIEDGIHVFKDAAQFVADLEARNTASPAPATV